MSGKFLGRLTTLSLVLFLAACGGDDDSSPLAPIGDSTGGGSDPSAPEGDAVDGEEETDQETILALGAGSGDSFVEGQIQTDIENLPPRGSASLTVSVVDAASGNNLVTDQDVEVGFRSGCVTDGTASIDSPIITGSGVARTTYTANGCFPTDTITAFVGDGAQASVVLNIDAADADRIISNDPELSSVAPAGSGSAGRPSESEVSFRVVDKTGDPVPGVTVQFELSGDTASPSIPVSIEPTEAESDSNGEVSTLVIAGSDSTVVRVIAGIETPDGGLSQTQSPPIAINSTIPFESGLSLAADNFIPDAQFKSGVEVAFTIFAADKNGQNVRGNTIVNFTTDGGSITPECQLIEDGTCSVVWRSQDPRLDEPEIAASTIGELPSGDVGTISQSARLFVSSSRNPSVTLTSEGGDTFCASVSVADRSENRIHPPAGTTVTFTIADGEILSTQPTRTVGTAFPSDKEKFSTCISAKPEDAAVPATLTVTASTPGGTFDEANISVPGI